MSTRRVRFNPVITIITEPPHLTLLLHETRQSDFYQRQLDKLRFEKMLTPIFCPQHRKKLEAIIHQHNDSTHF